ncbi:hypothetical protein [Paenarthrobacter aurescens]|jgi:hypothetical protein|uniref:Uncharacterized protein n=1 Tax=Paenarthrobacter aurescens (strain TC1) TaxID=290340 RepID=A1RD48_PAEAT|nr:hypothetical protein [Paenarthrobacter aurescens]ABM10418.1 hypothetical protein AAur_pTC10291 [Paenarthrobacter aurescens TC1]
MTTPLPADATWTDYVDAHGGPEAPGWWVILRWYADSEHPRPEVVGPYATHQQAVAAMQHSALIDGFAEDTNREESLDDVYVDPIPASIARTCADYGPRVTLIDPGDPNHFGGGHAPKPPADSARTGLMQASALREPDRDKSNPPTAHAAHPGHRSPGTPGL